MRAVTHASMAARRARSAERIDAATHRRRAARRGRADATRASRRAADKAQRRDLRDASARPIAAATKRRERRAASPSDTLLATANVCTQPTSSDATSAPPNEPSPPITTTTNTIEPSDSAIAGSITKSGAPITPASAASAVPAANTPVNTRGTLWPSASTALAMRERGAHDQPRLRHAQHRVQHRQHRERHRHHERAITRECRAVDGEQRAVEHGRHRRGQRVQTPDELDRFAEQIRGAERQQQFGEMAMHAHASQQPALERRAEQTDDERRDRSARSRSRRAPPPRSRRTRRACRSSHARS